MKVCVCVFKFSETAGPSEAKFHVAPPWDRGKDGKHSNDLGHWLLFFIVNPRGRGHLAGILPQIWPRSAGL